MDPIVTNQKSQKTSHHIELLDGGTGEECFRLGVPDDRTIWSARALVDEQYHEIVRQVHRNFIIAGSQYITTNNYSVTPGVGLLDRLAALTKVAARLAFEARMEAEQLGYRGVRICGSLPPLIESYRPDLVLPHDQAVAHYLTIIRSLNDSVDIFLAETMSSIAEATAAVDAVEEIGSQKKVWVSWTLNSDGRLRSGEGVADAINSLLHKKVAAILFNCSEPEAICRALTEIRVTSDFFAKIRANNIRIGAYANRLNPVPEDFAIANTAEPEAMRSDLSVERYTQFAQQWVALGADLIGGCCGVGPEYITDLRRCFRESLSETGDLSGNSTVENLPNDMLALQFQRHRGIQHIRCAIPVIADNHVLIRVEYAGICGSDLHILQETSRYSDQVILGHEAVGHVVACGRNVPQRLSAGDTVVLQPQFACGECIKCRKGQPNFCEIGGYSSTLGYWHDGCFAEYCAAHQSQFYPIPPSLPLRTALLCEPFNCIMNGWNKMQNPALESRTLIMGAGIFGLLWASLFHAKGYPNVVITEPQPGREQIAQKLCEHTLVGYRIKKPVDLDTTDRFDVIIECCGTAQAVADAFRHLDVSGRLLVFGGAPKNSEIRIDPSDILYKELTISGTVIGQNTFFDGISTLSELFAKAYIDLDLLGVREFALQEYATAVRMLEQGLISKAIFALNK